MKFDSEKFSITMTFMFLLVGVTLFILGDVIYSYFSLLFAFSSLILCYILGIEKKLDKLSTNFVQQKSPETSFDKRGVDTFSKISSRVQSSEPTAPPSKNDGDSLKHG